MKVKELIDVETGQWDRARIGYWFKPYTCADILHLPLPNIQSNDVIVWKESKSNSFSVKSAYSIALTILHPPIGNHSNAGTDGKLWTTVWSLNDPPKARTFRWRVCSNILPTFDNLYLKRTQIDPICTVCNQQRETGVHILWECLFACNVQALVKDKIQKSPAATSDFFMLTRTMMQRLTWDELEQWGMIMQAIWNASNKHFFEDIQTHPEAILRSAKSLLHEYQTLMADQRT